MNGKNKSFLLGDVAKEFYLTYFATLSDYTERWYKNSLKKLINYLGEDKPVKEISRMDLLEWRKAITEIDTKYASAISTRPIVYEKLAISTIAAYIRATRGFFGWMYKERYIEENPALVLKRITITNQQPKAIHEDDFTAMLLANDQNERFEYRIRNLAIFLFTADTGCRIGGVVKLKLNDLSLTKKEAVVHEKGNQQRMVFFGDACRAALYEWIKIRPKIETELVFTTLRKPCKPLSIEGISKLFTITAKKAGIKGRSSPHSFRHAAARNWLSAGANLSVVSQLLGHKSISVTNDFYARWNNRELRENHQKMEVIDKHLDDSALDLETLLRKKKGSHKNKEGGDDLKN